MLFYNILRYHIVCYFWIFFYDFYHIAMIWFRHAFRRQDGHLWTKAQSPPAAESVHLFCSLCEKQSRKKEVKCKSCNGNKGAHNYRAVCPPSATHWVTRWNEWVAGWWGGQGRWSSWSNFRVYTKTFRLIPAHSGVLECGLMDEEKG